MGKLVTIPIGELKTGMFVVSAGEGTFTSPKTAVNTIIRQPFQITALARTGAETVVIDTGKAADLRVSEGDVPAASKEFTEAVRDVDRTMAQAVSYSRTMMEDVRLGKSVNTREASQVVESMLESIFRNESAAIFLTKLGNYDDYTYMHCVNVSVLASIFARHLGFDDHQIFQVGLSGLLHDIGKALIPESILNKPGTLTEKEFAVMRSHTVKGFDLVKNVQGLSRDVLLGMLEHHEKWSGGGYPRNLQGERISSFARILAVVDIYDAMTSNRVYHKGRAETDVLGYLFSHKNDFAPTYVERFVKTVGIYPPGTVIRLSNGMKAMVCATNAADGLRPSVSPVNDEMLIAPFCVALDSLGDPNGPLKVEEVLDRFSLEIDLSQLTSDTY